MSKTQAVFALLALLGLAALPHIWPNPYYVHLMVVIGIYAILLLGLDFVVGYVGEVSLGHAALFGVGAYTAGVLKFQLNASFLLALPAGIAVTAVFGLLLALPALRVSGPYLAMVTLAFGTIVQILINEMTFLTNGPMGIALQKPMLFGHRLSGADYYYVVMVALVLTLILTQRLVKSHLGRAFEALRDSPVASDCMAVSVYRYKVYAFVISAAMAGLAGSLFTYSEEYISPDTYNFQLTVLFLLALIMGGRKTRTGPILGAIIVVMLPNVLADIDLFRRLSLVIVGLAVAYTVYGITARRHAAAQIAVPLLFTIGLAVFAYRVSDIADYRLTIFGLLILFVVYYLPDGIMGFVRGMVAQYRPQWIHRHEIIQAAGSAQHVWAAPDRPATAGNLLEVRNVTMQFGGLKALDNVELIVAKGSVHGLIGPNGSGKSTMMNVLTGIYRPTAGQIAFGNKRIAGMSPSAIAGAGIARTFQNVQLFGEMTAIENVLVGLHHTYHSNFLHVALNTRHYRDEERVARMRAASLLQFVGLASLANEEARNLPYGKQRLLEIARALALNPSLLLLDEPAAGLTAPDIKELIGMIEKIRDHGIAIVLIEHHMDVVMGISDIVSVLDFGHKIAEGEPAAVQADEKVIAAYLGGKSEQAA